VEAEAGFTILLHRGKIPVLAACTRCRLKFFTPTNMMEDPERAKGYLRNKYEVHHCRVLLIFDNHRPGFKVG
jgi:hypothetical protein